MKRRAALLWLVLLTPSVARGLELSECEVVRLALENNLGVRMAAADREIARTDIGQARSVFDTTLNIAGNYTVDKSDQPTPLFGTDNRETTFDVGLSKVLPSGTRTAVDWTNQRASTNSAFATMNPYVDAGVTISATQPLLQNFFGYQDRGGVSIAKKLYASMDEASRRRTHEAVYGVILDYWSWIAYRDNVRVAERSLQEAQSFEKMSLWKKDIGRAEETDVLAARANRLQLETGVVEARRLEQDALLKLKLDLEIDPSESVASREGLHIGGRVPGRDEALQLAFDRRGDYRALRREAEAKDLEVSLAKNRLWPSLDLVSSLKLNGISGDWGDSLSEVGGADHPRYVVGGQLSWSFENRAARSESKKAEYEREKLLLRIKEKENQILQEVESGYRKMIAKAVQARTHREIEALQEKKWQAEREKYRTGNSTSDLVIRYLQDYLSSRRTTLSALLEYRAALMELCLAQESLVENILGGSE